MRRGLLLRAAREHRSRAFTLVELIAVIVIVAVLVGVAAMSYVSFIGHAHDVRAQAQITTLTKLAAAARIQDGTDLRFTRDHFADALSEFSTAPDAVLASGPLAAGDNTKQSCEARSGVYRNGWCLLPGNEVPRSQYEFAVSFDDAAGVNRSDVTGARAAVVTKAEYTGHAFGTRVDMVPSDGLASSGDAASTAPPAVFELPPNATAQDALVFVPGKDPITPLPDPTTTTPTPAPTTETPAPSPSPTTTTPTTAPTTETPAPSPSPTTPTTTPTPTPTPTPSADNFGDFDQAVYSQGSFTLTNNVTLLRTTYGLANAYTAGNFTCNSGARVDGNLMVSGTVSLTNTCRVDQDVRANGSVTTSTDTVRVAGSIISTAGNITFGNHGLYVGDQIRAAGKVISSDGRPVTTAAGNLPQTGVIGLTRVPDKKFPVVTYDPAQWPGFGVKTWAAWLVENADANKASASSSARKKPCSLQDSASYSLNGPLTSPAAPTVIDAMACSSISVNSVDLKLRGDLTIFAKSFTSSNALRVTSADGAQHKLRIIVPFASATQTCGQVTGNLRFNSGGTVVDPKVDVLLYSADSVYLTNQVDMRGQVYGCDVASDSDITIRFVPVGIPQR